MQMAGHDEDNSPFSQLFSESTQEKSTFLNQLCNLFQMTGLYKTILCQVYTSVK
jgi:hypothetical protein